MIYSSINDGWNIHIELNTDHNSVIYLLTQVQAYFNVLINHIRFI